MNHLPSSQPSIHQCAPAIYQCIVDQMLEGIAGAVSVMDIIAAPTVQEHDTIRQVVKKATSYNLRLNVNKCLIRQPSVPYVGHLITADGLKPDPAKVEAVQGMSSPGELYITRLGRAVKLPDRLTL